MPNGINQRYQDTNTLMTNCTHVTCGPVKLYKHDRVGVYRHDSRTSNDHTFLDLGQNADDGEGNTGNHVDGDEELMNTAAVISLGREKQS